MINQQLFNYIKQQLQQGISEEQIKNSLLTSDWQTEDIDEVFNSVKNFNSRSQLASSSQAIFSLPSATAILGQAWVIYKQRIGIFLGVMIIPMLISIVTPILVSMALSVTGGFFGLSIFLVILFSVIVFIVQIWGQIALLYAIKDSQERIGVMESYRRAWYKIFSYWWVILLISFITLGGFLFFIVPGIIFAVWFSLAVFVLVAEDLKGMDALLKSREYVKGKWGSVLWRSFFIGIIFFIISLILIFLLSFLKIPFGEVIGRFAIGLFLTPLMMTYWFLVYKNLKAAKEEIVFVPTESKKTAFIFVGILGILIIPAILFSSIFSSLGSAKEKARDARRQADINRIRIGLDIYHSEYNSYPFSLNEFSSEYLPKIPVDPLTNQPYKYQLQSDGKDYNICTQLESMEIEKCFTSQF